MKLCRHAVCGFGATCVSDVVSNVIRVLKTTVQTAEVSISYTEVQRDIGEIWADAGRCRPSNPNPNPNPNQAAKQVIEKEGVIGLFTRGLGTRLLTNGIQASLFSVVWKVRPSTLHPKPDPNPDPNPDPDLAPHQVLEEQFQKQGL